MDYILCIIAAETGKLIDSKLLSIVPEWRHLWKP